MPDDLELQRLRQRLVTLLIALRFQKQCLEISGIIGVREVCNGLCGKSIDWFELGKAMLFAFAGIKIPATIAKSG